MVKEIDEGVPTIQRRVRDRMEARLKEAEALMREGGTEMAEGETPQE